METLIEARHVVKRYGARRRLPGVRNTGIQALRGVEFSVRRGQTLGIVGESGCGKSTLARVLLGLEQPTAGTISIAAEARGLQYVFQNPQASLNPRKTIRQTLEQPLRYRRNLKPAQREAELAALLDAVQLPAAVLERYPHEFSGGQAQRIVIARALASNPGVLILDEPVSALDVSVQAQILNLLALLREQRQLTYVFISHDMSVVERICDHIMVMYFGSVVEWGSCEEVFENCRHPYTRMLLDSVPRLRGKPLSQRTDSGELPNPADPPDGCAFASRCPRADSRCHQEVPVLPRSSEEHVVACFNPLG